MEHIFTWKCLASGRCWKVAGHYHHNLHLFVVRVFESTVHKCPHFFIKLPITGYCFTPKNMMIKTFIPFCPTS